MEFEHVGVHCAACRRKDFLPVHCNLCTKDFCKSCFSESYHTSGCTRRDMTSFDCPVCGKSVKHGKDEDVNEVWGVHFSTECQQVAPVAPSSASQVDKCYYEKCKKPLGPSNRFKCPKCHKEVCLSHRMVEAHECTSLHRNTTTALRNNKLLPQQTKKPATTATKVQQEPTEVC